MIANEQTRTPSVNPKTIDVNALHIVVGDPLENVVLADVVIAHSHADVVCQGGPPNCDRARFVAGGGWINSGTSTANFAIAGRNGDPSTWRHAVHVTR